MDAFSPDTRFDKPTKFHFRGLNQETKPKGDGFGLAMSPSSQADTDDGSLSLLEK
jgi:hypothetical protein